MYPAAQPVIVRALWIKVWYRALNLMAAGRYLGARARLVWQAQVIVANVSNAAADTSLEKYHLLIIDSRGSDVLAALARKGGANVFHIKTEDPTEINRELTDSMFTVLWWKPLRRASARYVQTVAARAFAMKNAKRHAFIEAPTKDELFWPRPIVQQGISDMHVFTYWACMAHTSTSSKNCID